MAKLAATMALAPPPSKSRATCGEVGVGEPGRADDGMDALLRVVGHVVAHRLGHGEVDHHLGSRSPSALTSPTMVRPQASPPTWPGSTAATNSMSGAAATARQTSWPMRPPAPTTPTF